MSASEDLELILKQITDALEHAYDCMGDVDDVDKIILPALENARKLCVEHADSDHAYVFFNGYAFGDMHKFLRHIKEVGCIVRMTQ